MSEGIKHWTRAVTLGLLWVAIVTTGAGAQGFIVPDPHPRPIPPRHHPVFFIAAQHADVRIQAQVARTTIEQVFSNRSRGVAEGVYLFPIPDEAAISSFSMWMNGREVKGEIVEAREARRIYEDIVRRTRDPGLLEYVGRDLFRARVFPISAGGEVRIRIVYEEVLPYDAGLVTYRYPLRTQNCACGPIGEVSVAVEIRSAVPVKSLYSPTHDIDARIRGKEASCGFEERDVAPDRDFILYYTVSEELVGVNVLTHRVGSDDGYFMMLLSPGALDDGRRIGKDIVFVLDKSGSMKGEKMEQARAALRYCIRNLNAEDRFNLVAFSTSVHRLGEELLDASRANRRRALEFIDRIEARGGTNINAALTAALDFSTRSRRPRMVVFLTDGLATVGVKDDRSILDNMKRGNRAGARVFPFGVGYDVNTHLLDRMSIDHKGLVEYLKPEEDIKAKVAGFYNKIASPVLSSVSLGVEGVRLEDMYPRSLPDIFSGSQVVVVGRYHDSGRATVELTGYVGDDERRYVYDARFHRRTRSNSFIPRLWATRKIGYLLSEIKLGGGDRELIDEVIRLSLEHGIVTPYTSYLILEEGSEEERAELLRQAPETPVRLDSPVRSSDSWTRARTIYDRRNVRGGRMAAGEVMNRASQEINEQKNSNVVGREASQNVRYVGSKRFVQKGRDWVDVDYREKSKVIDVVFLSDEYFRLIAENPDIGQFMALGRNVTFVYNNQAYRVQANDK